MKYFFKIFVIHVVYVRYQVHVDLVYKFINYLNRLTEGTCSYTRYLKYYFFDESNATAMSPDLLEFLDITVLFITRVSGYVHRILNLVFKKKKHTPKQAKLVNPCNVLAKVDEL